MKITEIDFRKEICGSPITYGGEYQDQFKSEKSVVIELAKFKIK